MTPENISDLIRKLRDCYRRADEFARLISEYRGEVVIPAHNQLRYAGHHLLNALSDDGVAVTEEELREAISHCERAVCDAGAAGIISALDLLDKFFHDYRDIPIREIVPESAEFRKLASGAQDFLSGMNSQENMPESVEAYMDTFRKLREACQFLEHSRDDLNARMASIICGHRRFIAVIAVTLLGIIVAIVIGLSG